MFLLHRSDAPSEGRWARWLLALIAGASVGESVASAVVYHPLQSYFESRFYGEFVARVADSFSQESPLIWSVRHLDTPLLIALAATALRWRRTLPPYWKVLFHWGLFVCALWAAGHPYDSIFFDIRLLHAFGF